MLITYLIALQSANENNEEWECADMRIHLDGTKYTEFNAISHQGLITPTDAQRGDGLNWSEARLTPPEATPAPTSLASRI